MSVADNSHAAPDEIYQRQMTSYRRTRAAILESAKKSLETQGFGATSMIDIADTAEISRATLYNHFRDKGSVYRALAESEVSRIFDEARRAPSGSEALLGIATAISADPALANLRDRDPGLVTRVLSDETDPLWEVIVASMTEIFGESAELALTWLVGAALQPVPTERIPTQVERLLRC